MNKMDLADAQPSTPPSVSDVSAEESGHPRSGQAGNGGECQWEGEVSKLITAFSTLSKDPAFKDIRAVAAQISSLRLRLEETEQQLEAGRRASGSREEEHARSVRDVFASYHALRQEAEGVEADLRVQLDRAHDQHRRSISDLNACRSDNMALRAEIDDLGHKLEERNATCIANGKLIETLEEGLIQRDRQIQSLEEKLRTSEKNREDARGSIQTLKKQHSTLVEESERLAGELRRFSSYTQALNPLDLDDCVSRLGAIWESLRTAIFGVMTEDVPDSNLKASKAWQSFRRAIDMPLEVPIHASNSRNAKDMRAAAVLGLAARLISDRIFSPCYLFQDPKNEMRTVLNDEAFYGAEERERLLRGLLIAISSDQEVSGSDVIDQTVKDIAWAVAPIVTSAQEDNLKREIRPVLSDAMRLWHRVQRGEQKLESSVDIRLLTENGPLRPLPLQHEDDMASTSKGDDVTQDDLVVVFPSIFAFHAEKLCCIFRGYSLRREQTQAAAAEATDLEATSPTGARSLSSMSRRPSTSAAGRPPQRNILASLLGNLT